MLAGIDAPIDAGKNDGVAAFEAEIADAKNGTTRHARLLTGEWRAAK